MPVASTMIFGRFFRFCCVGGAGFLVDAATLVGLMNATRLGPLTARLISLTVAITTTYMLHRLWAFRQTASRPLVAGFAVYVGLQGAGVLVNLLVYAALLSLLPQPFARPLICLALASGAAMVLNYIGLVRVVFKGGRP